MSHTKAQLWEAYISKNPHWENDNITLTPSGLKKLVESSYTHGYTHGVTVAGKVHEHSIKKATSKHSYKSNTRSDAPFGDMF